MFFEQYAENMATLILDGSTVFLLGGVFFATGIMRKRGRDDDKLFFILLFINMVVALSDIATYLADGKSFAGARYINMGGVSVFYMAMVLLGMVWLHYCIVRFQSRFSRIWEKHKLIFVPGLIMEALLLINIFTGFIFSVDINNVYHYGNLFWLMYLVMALYVFTGFFLILGYRPFDDRKVLIPVWLYLLPLVAGLIVPFVLGGISLTSIGCAMSITFTHLGSASEIINSDKDQLVS